MIENKRIQKYKPSTAWFLCFLNSKRLLFNISLPSLKVKMSLILTNKTKIVLKKVFSSAEIKYRLVWKMQCVISKLKCSSNRIWPYSKLQSRINFVCLFPIKLSNAQKWGNKLPVISKKSKNNRLVNFSFQNKTKTKTKEKKQKFTIIEPRHAINRGNV